MQANNESNLWVLQAQHNRLVCSYFGTYGRFLQSGRKNSLHSQKETHEIIYQYSSCEMNQATKPVKINTSQRVTSIPQNLSCQYAKLQLKIVCLSHRGRRSKSQKNVHMHSCFEENHREGQNIEKNKR